MVTKSAKRSSRSSTEMKGSAGGSRNAAANSVSGNEGNQNVARTDEKKKGSLCAYIVSRSHEQRVRETYLTGDVLDWTENHENDGYEPHGRATDDRLDLGP